MPTMDRNEKPNVSLQELERRVQSERAVSVVVNTRSRRGARLFHESTALLTERGVRIVSAHPVSDPRRLPDVIRECMRQDESTVVVGGGDGTLSSASGLFAYTDKVMGILPLGTSNSFARTLMIPSSMEEAIDIIAGGLVVHVDLGQVNGRYFGNMTSLGLSAEVAANTPNWLKRVLGPLAYVSIGLRDFITCRRFNLTIEMGDERRSIPTYQVMVANGRYFGPFPVAPRAEIDNRQLLLVTFEAHSKLELIGFWLAYVRDRHLALADSRWVQASSFTIETDPTQRLNVDGEMVAENPAHFTVAPGALNVIASSEFSNNLPRDDQPSG